MKRYTLATVTKRPVKSDDWCYECGERATFWLDLEAYCGVHYADCLAEAMFHAKVTSKTVGAWA